MLKNGENAFRSIGFYGGKTVKNLSIFPWPNIFLGKQIEFCNGESEAY